MGSDNTSNRQSPAEVRFNAEDEDDTLREVGEEHEFEFEDEEAADRRRDPLRQPH